MTERKIRGGLLALLAVVALGAAACRPLQRTSGTASATATAATAGATTGDQEGSLVIGGLTRTYLLHTPGSYTSQRPAPLLLALHGRNGNGKSMAEKTSLSKVADQYGFIVVYPDGYRGSWNVSQTAPGGGGVDDIGFFTTLIATISQHYAIDQQRIYVTGMSDGAFMTENLACVLSTKIAAVAASAAILSAGLANRCAPTHPMPVLLFNGTSDPIVPYQGGVIASGAGQVPALSAPQTAAKWAALAGCAPTPASNSVPTTVNDGTSVSYVTYSGCGAGAQVRLYTITGGGHAWPGGTSFQPVGTVGKTTGNLNASQTLWQFVSQFTLAN